MIEFLSKWIEGIAIAVIIASLFEMLLPNGNIKKYVKAILGIYIVFNIISPFAQNHIKANYDISKKVDDLFSNDERLSNDLNGNNDAPEKRLNTIYENTFEKELIKTIEKEGFIVYKCEVKGVFDAEEENAGISKINITIESKKVIRKDETNTIYEKESLNENENNIKIYDVNEIEKIDINVKENKTIEKNEDINSKDIDTLRKYLSKHYEIDKDVIKIYIR